MARTAKVLAQANPAAATSTDIYTVPEETECVISSIVVANRDSGSADACRIAVRAQGEALADKHYLAYDYDVPANDYISLVLGITLGPGDIITVRDANGDLSFNVFGIETTLR